ncbi:protein Flattop isoform X1 [Struthio camelus]|uniref:protein Flattop isoform X1 n=1 Tax=Struthio camelus TaxID=8801 RepID=UPI003603BA47
MAARYGAGQYEGAFDPRSLRNWSVPRSARQRPLPRDGYTQIIADDRGHLLPSVPRSKASPWGTFLGTWDMPLKIPPARLNLTSRSAAAAAQLTDWIHKSTTLTSACNGLRPEITGKPQADRALPVCRGFSPPHAPGEPSKEPNPAANPACGSRPPWPQEPWSDTQDTREPSGKASRTSSKGIQNPQLSPKMAVEEKCGHEVDAMVGVPLSRKLGHLDVRLREDVSPEIPASCQPHSKQAKHRVDSPAEVPLSRQPGFTDLRLRDAISPKIPASLLCTSREASPQQPTSVEVSAPSWSGSIEAKPKAGSSPSLVVSPCRASAEASPRGSTSPEALVPGHSASKASCASRTRKGTAKREKSVSPEQDGWTRCLPCSEERAGQTPQSGPSTRQGQTSLTRF